MQLDAQDDANFRDSRLRAVSPGFGAAMWVCAVALTQGAPLPPCAQRTAEAHGVDPRRLLLAWMLVEAVCSAGFWIMRVAVHDVWLVRAARLQHVCAICALVLVEQLYCAPALFLLALPAQAARASLGPPLVCSESAPLVLATTCLYGAHLLASTALRPAGACHKLAPSSSLSRCDSEEPHATVEALALWLALAVFVGAELGMAVARERAERSYFKVRPAPVAEA